MKDDTSSSFSKKVPDPLDLQYASPLADDQVESG